MTLRNKLSKKYNIFRNGKLIQKRVLAKDVRNISQALEKQQRKNHWGGGEQMSQK